MSAFHDIGLTSDDKVPHSDVLTMRQLAIARFAKVPRKPDNGHAHVIKALCEGREKDDQLLIEEFLNRVDISYMNGDKPVVEEAFSRIVKSLEFLGFFDNEKHRTSDGKGEPLSFIDVFGNAMAQKMTHGEDDRDLVVMRHNFVLQDKDGRRWKHTSTLIDSGQSFRSGGQSLMSKTVGITTAIGTRMILEGKIQRKGVLSPIYKDVYEPIMKELERFGIAMIEDSERNDLKEKK